MRCPACQCDLADNAPIYRYRVDTKGGATVIQCAACAARMSARRAAWPGLGLGMEWRPPAPCESCGRPVIDRVILGYVVLRHITCGEPACQRAIRAAPARARRRRPCVCLGCGIEFKPARDDARYCSPACKQRAYRRRLSLTATATPP